MDWNICLQLVIWVSCSHKMSHGDGTDTFQNSGFPLTLGMHLKYVSLAYFLPLLRWEEFTSTASSSAPVWNAISKRGAELWQPFCSSMPSRLDEWGAPSYPSMFFNNQRSVSYAGLHPEAALGGAGGENLRHIYNRYLPSIGYYDYNCCYFYNSWSCGNPGGT